MPRNSTPPVCPNCRADVPPRALACPKCGSDHSTGWREYGYNGGADSQEDDFDYNESFKKEFGSNAIPTNVKPIWWITGIVLLVLVVIGLVRSIMR